MTGVACPVDADTAAVLRAAHRKASAPQLLRRVADQEGGALRAGGGLKLRQVRAIAEHEFHAGRLRSWMVGEEIHYSRTKAGSLALKAWQQHCADAGLRQEVLR